MRDNLHEYAWGLKPGGLLIASVTEGSSYIFHGVQRLPVASYRISLDHSANRVGYRPHALSDKAQLDACCFTDFQQFSFGQASNHYFGITEKLFWLICRKI